MIKKEKKQNMNENYMKKNIDLFTYYFNNSIVMSLEDIYDADCHFIKSIDKVKEEEDLIESINKKHLYGVNKSQYPIEFLRKLNKLLNEDIIDFECDDSNYIKQIGNYYKGRKNYENMKKYYLLAIEKGDGGAMNNLALFYAEIKKFELMKYYFLMAIDKGDTCAINNFGKYCKENKDYDNMKKCYLKAIENNDVDAMNKLGYHYWKQKDFENMKKYYEMAIKQDNVWAMDRLGDYYNEQKDYDNMEKYYRMAIGKGSANSEEKLNKYYEEMINDIDSCLEDSKICIEKIKKLI